MSGDEPHCSRVRVQSEVENIRGECKGEIVSFTKMIDVGMFMQNEYHVRM